MLKGFGLILIFLSITGVGFKLSMALSEKHERLLAIKALISEFISDLSFKRTPTFSIIDRVKNEKSFDKLSFLKRVKKPLPESFEREINSDRDLSNEEKNLLSELGKIIGSTNSEVQINLLNDLKNRVDGKILKSRLEKEEKGRLFALGGIFIGFFVVILIV